MDPDIDSLPWLKHFQTFGYPFIENPDEEMGDFVNNRYRKQEKEPLWPENSHLIFYTRQIVPDTFRFYRYSLIRKKAAPFLKLDLNMPENMWTAWFCGFEKYFFAYVKGNNCTFLFCYDLEKNLAKQWKMPYLNAKEGLCLYPTRNALYIDVCYPDDCCRVSYRHQRREASDQNQPVWLIASEEELPCESDEDEMYEFDISQDARAYDPRNHWEDDHESDRIYIFNEATGKWDKVLCSETTGDYKNVVDTFTPCLRAIYRSFHHHPEIFHPGPDTKASELFACTEDEKIVEGMSSESIVRELYRGRIRPISLKTLALEALLASCPDLMELELEHLRDIGVPDRIAEMFVEHRNWEKQEMVSFVVGPGNLSLDEEALQETSLDIQ